MGWGASESLRTQRGGKRETVDLRTVFISPSWSDELRCLYSPGSSMGRIGQEQHFSECEGLRGILRSIWDNFNGTQIRY